MNRIPWYLALLAALLLPLTCPVMGGEGPALVDQPTLAVADTPPEKSGKPTDLMLVLPRLVAEPGPSTNLVVELHSATEIDFTYLSNDEKRKPILSGFARFGSPTTVVFGACESTVIYFSRLTPSGMGEIPVKLESGCFAVDKTLGVLPKGTWEGKKDGAVHKLVGRISILDYEFESDEDDPLTFVVTGKGYRFLHGIGKIADATSAKTYRQEKPTKIGRLFKASREGDVATVRKLLDEGVDPNASPSGGRTCLMVASENGHPQVVKTLLSKGAKANLQEWKVKFTALMVAAKHGQAEIVKLLLEAGADPSVKDKDTWTALRWAVSRGHKDVETLLDKSGAKD